MSKLYITLNTGVASGMNVCSTMRYEQIKLQFPDVHYLNVRDFDVLSKNKLFNFVKLFFLSVYCRTPIGVLRYSIPNSYLIEYDEVFLENICTTSVVLNNNFKKIVLVLQNADHEYVRRLSRECTGIRSVIYMYEYFLYVKHIRRLLSKCDETWCLTDTDTSSLRKLSSQPSESIRTLPLEFNLKKIQDYFPKFKKPRRLAYLGTSSHIFNVSGLVWYLLNCHSSLLERYGKLHIVGSGWRDVLEQNKIPSNLYKAYGFVDVIHELLDPLDTVFIVPIFNGSGIKIKVLDTLSMGYRTVVSKHAALGFENISTNYLRTSVDDDAESWVKFLNDL